VTEKKITKKKDTMKKILVIIAVVVGTTYLFAQGPIPVNEKKTGNVTGKTKENARNLKSSFDFSGASTGDMLKFNGTKWVKFTPPATTFGNCESCQSGFSGGYYKWNL
jgi:hypothetical protein